MKKKNSVLRKVLAVALSAVTLLGTGFTMVGQFVGTDISVSASETYDDFEYVVNEDGNTITITKYIGVESNVIIPSEIDGKSVTSIGWYAFYLRRGLVTNITIPDGVKSIYGAFEDCINLTNVIIPDSVTEIGSAFSGCTSLVSIDIPNGVTEITSWAFSRCKSLTSITIPESVQRIENSAFFYCDNLKNINVDKHNRYYFSLDGVLFNGSGTSLLIYPSGRAGKYTVPNMVNSIKDAAFFNCCEVTEIEIPSSITEIGYAAFMNCKKLEKITIPNGVEFGSSLFAGCENLTDITLPESINALYGDFFADCKRLTKVYIPKNVTFVSIRAFSGCDSLMEICVDEKNEKYSSVDGILFSKDKSIIHSFPGGREGKYEIPDLVVGIEDYCFENCKNLSNVLIPFSVKSIGDYAFMGCINIKRLYIPSSVEKIGYEAIGYYEDLCDRTPSSSSYSTGHLNITVIGYKDSEAETYANKAGFSFIEWTKLSNISNISSNEVTLGDAVIINAKADGGIGSYEYEILYKAPSGSDWKILQDYSKKSTSIFEPKQIGTYNIRVNVKDIDDKIVPKDFSLKVKAIPLENLSTLSAETIALGGKITLTAAATGGTREYLYQVVYKQKTQSKWTTAQDFSTNDTVTIKPAQATDYDICVKVKDGSGKIVKKYFEVKVNAKLANTSVLSAENITLGQQITVNGLAQGGMGEYQYQVVYKQTSQSKWTTAQAFSENATVTFKPAKATTYDVCVKVKDSNGTVVKKFFTVQVNAKLTNTSAVSATEIKKGSTVTVNGSATGGVGDYTYAVYYKQKAQTKWTVKQDFNENSDVSVKPAQATDYDICVKVKDKDGTIAKQYFTVTVTK